MIRPWGIAALLAAVLAAEVAGAAVTGAELQRALAASGPDTVLRTYFVPDTGEGYPAVESGDAAAVAVAAALLRAPATDGGATLSLRSALATGLQANPAAVLPLIDTHPALAADAVCVPFLPVDQPPERVRLILDRTRDALANAAAKDYAAQAHACDGVLARAYASLGRKARR